jgi:hypothetical protein
VCAAGSSTAELAGLTAATGAVATAASITCHPRSYSFVRHEERTPSALQWFKRAALRFVR